MFGPVILKQHCMFPPPCRMTRTTSLISKRSQIGVCLAGDTSKPDLVDDTTMSNLSPMAREVFREAQENILALNRSRLKALEELKHAKNKIAELEKKLEEATEQVTSLVNISLQDVQATPSYSAPSNNTTSNNGSQASVSTSSADSVFFSFENSCSPQSPSSAENTQTHKVTLIYESGWEYAYIHCKVDGSKWTPLPGKPIAIMTDGEFAGKKVVALDCDRLEFVMTDGHGRFDAPNPYGEPDKPTNYVIDAPGVYRLKSGKLTKLS